MPKIVVDTNVLVSALIQRGYPYHIMTEVFSNQDIELCISDTLFEEYWEVLNRKKFIKYKDFTMKEFKGAKIVNPKEFWTEYMAK